MIRGYDADGKPITEMEPAVQKVCQSILDKLIAISSNAFNTVPNIKQVSFECMYLLLQAYDWKKLEGGVWVKKQSGNDFEENTLSWKLDDRHDNGESLRQIKKCVIDTDVSRWKDRISAPVAVLRLEIGTGKARFDGSEIADDYRMEFCWDGNSIIVQTASVTEGGGHPMTTDKAKELEKLVVPSGKVEVDMTPIRGMQLGKEFGIAERIKSFDLFEAQIEIGQSMQYLQDLAKMMSGKQKIFYDWQLDNAKICKMSTTPAGIKRGRPKEGLCYQNAYRVVADNYDKEIEYVEGTVMWKNCVPMEHAWNKIGDIYFDVTHELAFKGNSGWNDYVSIVEIKSDKMYEIASDTGVYGGCISQMFRKIHNL